MPYVSSEDANNRPVDSLEDIEARNGPPPWRERVAATERFRMLLLCWPPGHHHPRHYHPRADESWYIIKGQVGVKFDDEPEIVASPGSFLLAKRGVIHDMTATGNQPLVMIAIVTPNQPDDEVQV